MLAARAALGSVQQHAATGRRLRRAIDPRGDGVLIDTHCGGEVAVGEFAGYGAEELTELVNLGNRPFFHALSLIDPVGS